MESITNELSAIEAAAITIVGHAEKQKSLLDKEYQLLHLKFDEELETQTQAKIQAIREELMSTITELLDQQTDTNSDSIATLKKEYDVKHTHYAQQILKTITEV